MIEFFELFIIKIDLPRNEIVILLSSIKIKSDDFFRDVKIVKKCTDQIKTPQMVKNWIISFVIKVLIEFSGFGYRW